MANYVAKTRTNWFRVTDEEKFETLCKDLVNAELAENGKSGEDKRYCITVDESLDYCISKEECEYDTYEFFKEMQTLLPDDEAMIVHEIGSEKFNYFVSIATIVTKRAIKDIDLCSVTNALAAEMLKSEGGTGEYFDDI